MSTTSLESSKTMAGIGAILLILSPVPYGGIPLGIIGIILFLVGIKGFSDSYRDAPMYQNALTGIIYYIIAVIAGGVATSSLAIGFATLFLALFSILIFIIALIVSFIFYLLAAMRLRQTFFDLEQKTGEHNFGTAGRLIWIGAILTIIFVGYFIILVAWIFAAIAFFSMRLPGQQYSPPPPSYTPPPPPTATTPTATSQGTRYCPNCGKPVSATDTFCPNCGKELPPT